MGLVDVITGGSGSSQAEPIGIYRSGPVLEHFFGNVGLELEIGSQSRLPAVRQLLVSTNKQTEGLERIKQVIEQVADPREYLKEPPKAEVVVEYLNKRLEADGYRLKLVDQNYRLLPLGANAPVADTLTSTARILNLESVSKDFERALKEVEHDPAGAITAACSTVESVCKCILDELAQPYPNKETIQPLVREVLKHLALSLDSSEVEPDIKRILGGLASTAGGIGALRTHSGDAHGRGLKMSPQDSRTARLAIHAASTISLFLIETWQNRKSE